MGSLLHVASRREFPLPARCLVGRAPICDIALTTPDASSQHATLQWTGSLWEIQDLASRNGTYVAGSRLGRGEKAPLRTGVELRFARQGGVWRLSDESPPRPMAVNLRTGAIRPLRGGIIALPDDAAPTLSILYHSPEQWLVERDSEVEPIGDRALVLVNADPWRVHLAVGATATLEDSGAPLRMADLTLRFSFSKDEEYVELVALAPDRRIDLKARAHHYPMLILARERDAQRRAGVPPAEAGWLHQHRLLEMLRMEVSHLNISIHRSRAQLGEEGVVDPAALVERRPGTRQLRIGVDSLEFVPL